MAFTTHTTPSGFLLPSIHSTPPFFSEQPNETTLASFTDHWIKLILAYARHRRLFFLHVEDAETSGNDWDEVFKNERINRRVLPPYLEHIMGAMVAKNVAVFEPAKQTRSALLYWRLPEEWAETLHEWAASTGHLNTIMTFYEVTDPPLESPLSGIPVALLRKAIGILAKTSRAQLIAVADGEGVRFFSK
ncbi:ESCRT-II complex vps25 subunit [Armillaria fumosa]|nr:ESCRT-II complex vps25 subunit [Armillaria fumosa]